MTKNLPVTEEGRPRGEGIFCRYLFQGKWKEAKVAATGPGKRTSGEREISKYFGIVV